jgi:peptide/nickel transport system permease protein
MTSTLVHPAAVDDAHPVAPSRRRKPLGVLVWLSITWLVLLTLAAALADVLPLHDPSESVSVPNSIPTAETWLGTDANGRDLLSRTIHGARVSLVVGVAAVLASALVGGAIGLLAGYLRRSVDSVSTFVADVLTAFPALLLAASIVALTESRGVLTVVLAIGLIYVGPTIRLVRTQTMARANLEYVLAARAVGARHGRIILREILPNVLPTLMALMIVAMAGAIVAEGGLAYLNLSVAPPQPTWGGMIAAGKPRLDVSLYPVLVPGAALFLTVLSVTLIGDAVQKRQSRQLGAV